MLSEHPAPVLGIDCEGLAKQKPISLLQLSFLDHCYVFDLLVFNPFQTSFTPNLGSVLTSNSIVKIFHDFCEDGAALLNQFGILCQNVFDTQIAHRHIYTAINSSFEQNSFDYKSQQKTRTPNESQVGLNHVLTQYLGAKATNKNKEQIHSLMKQDEWCWYARPLSQDLLEYAAQDVLYLP